MNCRYPWDSLKKVGDFFIWKSLADERSVRSQANKQGKRRRIFYSVRKENRANGKRQLRVTLQQELS